MKVKKSSDASKTTDGFLIDRGRAIGLSSHRTFKKEGVAEIITVSGIDSKDMTPGQLQDIKRKAGWK